MKNLARIIVVLFLLVFLSGCYSTGLSVREKGSLNYSNFVYGLYNNSSADENNLKKIDFPISLGVAQIGEAKAPKLFIDKLKENSLLITKIVSMPSGAGYEESEEGSKKMRSLAQDLGVDYIFIFGGSADFRSTQNWTGVFDITIIGGFIFPSNAVTIEGKTSGALVDAKSGRVILIVDEEGTLKESVATYKLQSFNCSGGYADEMFAKLRDDLVLGLSEKLINKLREEKNNGSI
jgi:hypothetical protein